MPTGCVVLEAYAQTIGTGQEEARLLHNTATIQARDDWVAFQADNHAAGMNELPDWV